VFILPVLREDLLNSENIDKYITASKRYNSLSNEQREIIDKIRETLTLQELMYIVEQS